MPPLKNEDEIFDKGCFLVIPDKKRLGKKVADFERDMKKAFELFRGCIVEYGKTPHDFIMHLDGYSVFKMRHKVPERNNKRGSYRIYYLTNKTFDFFLPAFVYMREENYSNSQVIKILRERLQ